MKRQLKLWENTQTLHINRRDGHGVLNRPEKALSLNGVWDFLFMAAPEYSPENFFAVDYKLTDQWKTITVPSCWQLEGYGKMHYTDVFYPFPINPPFVPSENPTGLYRTSFKLNTLEENQDYILRFNGVDSAFELWVNGSYVGYSKVSRLASEFDITSNIVSGENNVSVRVVQWSDGTYLEDQDMWWFSGIFRDVECYKEPKAGFFDVKAEATLANNYKDGQLKVNVVLKSDIGKSEFHWELGQGQKVLGQGTANPTGKTINLSANIADVKPWTAETPVLYELSGFLMEAGKITDQFKMNIGFRTIEIEGEQILINGVPILFKGVNYHDSHPETGRTVTHDWVEKDIVLMKQHNINAVRCAHYPRMDYFYDLCDKLGLYVIDEADVEDHGFEWIGKYDWLSEGADWEASMGTPVLCKKPKA